MIALGFTRVLVEAAHIEKVRDSMIWAFLEYPFNPTYSATVNRWVSLGFWRFGVSLGFEVYCLCPIFSLLSVQPNLQDFLLTDN